MSLSRRSLPSALQTLAGALTLLALTACTNAPIARLEKAEIVPLHYDGKLLTVDEVARVPDVDLLALNDEMRAFVETYTGNVNNPRNRLLALHTAVTSPGALAVNYDPFADGSAQDVFRSSSANCLSYANLFVALAREAGLNANYQWMDVRPEWHRLGDRVALRLHVNVLVTTRDSEDFMVDIDPLRRHEIAGSKRLSDREAKALHHGNRAMLSLADDRVEEAWRQALRALELAPEMSHLWVNLGAIYRNAEQHDAAERAYFRALSLDSTDRSAMNNLVVLYGLTGREDEEQYWLDRMHRYRLRNPYYHANLGEIASENGDLDGALKHYEKAVELQPEDSDLIYSLGLIEHRRGNYERATRLVERAIEEANFAVDEKNYRIQLRAMRAERAVTL